MITVGIVDDEALIRGGIRGLLQHASDIAVVAEAFDGTSAIELVKQHKPHVLLMDIRMPNLDGLSATEAICALPTKTEVIILTTLGLDEHVQRALRAGAAGFLCKTGDPREIITAVRAVAAGDAMLSPEVTRGVINHFLKVDTVKTERARKRLGALTPREVEVLHQVARGLSNADIASILYMSEGAVKAHVSRMLEKLNCNNRVQVAILAYEASLMD